MQKATQFLASMIISSIRAPQELAQARYRSSWPIHADSIGKFPWELDGTNNYNGTEMRCWQKMACIKSSIVNDGFSMIGQNDKLYHVGEGSGLDDTRNGTHGTFPTRVGGA